MRLRDLGGLVVIDFIDMSSGKHQRMVEDRLQQALKLDRARVQIGKISRFGLLELSRQRLRPSLGESSQIVCPRCDGHGRMRSVESLSLSILRLSEEQAMKDKTAQVLVQAPPQIANYLLNEKRRALVEIESRHEAPIIIIADEALETPHFNVTRIREGDQPEDTGKPSYQRGVPRKLEVHALTKAQLNVPAEPAVTHVKPAQIAPPRQTSAGTEESTKQVPAAKKAGLFSKILAIFAGDAADEPKKAEQAPVRRNDNSRRDRPDNRGNARNAQNKQQRGNRPERPERTEEERKVADEQRKQRREEQQKRETERKEAQRAENQRREAEKRAQREAEAAARDAGGLNAQTEETADTAAETVTKLADGEANPINNELQADGTPRRRRGRRGGRRRRRQEGETAGAVDAANDQSEMDFEDADDVLFDATSPEQDAVDAPAAVDADNGSRQQQSAMPRTVPVIVTAIPVSAAESDFTDLETSVEPQYAASMQASAESDITSAVEEPLAPEPVVAAEDSVVEPVTQPAPAAQAEFIEPKPKQTGYVPVAPPSFSMPNTPNSGFDFTVRISPENRED
jgi:ribonuclease E